MRVLIIEDEPRVASFLTRALKEQNYVVSTATNGEDGLQMATGYPFNAILLDVLLPGISGIEVCRRLRRKGIQTPVIMLTARSMVEQRVEGLDAGADDYLVKPFAIAELLARLRALGRRNLSQRSLTLRYADLELDSRTRRAKRSGAAIPLSGKEFLLLELLLLRAPGTVTKAELNEHVWDTQLDEDNNLVEVYINRLRDKIDRDHPTRLIHTIRGSGYRVGQAE